MTNPQIPRPSGLRLVSLDGSPPFLKWDHPTGGKLFTEIQIDEEDSVEVFGDSYNSQGLEPFRNYVIQVRHKSPDGQIGKWARLVTRFTDRNRNFPRRKGFLRVSRDLYVQARDLKKGDIVRITHDRCRFLVREDLKSMSRYQGSGKALSSGYVLIQGDLSRLYYDAESGKEVYQAEPVSITAKQNDLFLIVAE